MPYNTAHCIFLCVFAFFLIILQIMITIKPMVEETCRELDYLAQSQVPFAIAKTLTDLAWESRGAIQDKMPSQFTLRSRWAVSGVRVNKATKQHLEAVVHHLDAKMEKQEIGGTVTAQKSRMLALPVTGPHGIRKSDDKLVSRRKRPAAIMKTPGTFVTRFKTGAVIIAHRRTAKRLPIDAKYLLVPASRYKPTWGFELQVQNVVTKRAEIIFERNLDNAIRTMI